MGTIASSGKKSALPPFEEFRQKFRDAFGRELTREERRFYRLVNIVLAEEKSAPESSEIDFDDSNGQSKSGKYSRSRL